MDSVSNTSDRNNRLSQIIRLMEKRSSEIQPFDSQIHDVLQVDESKLNIFCRSDNQTFINNDTIKPFLHNINQTSESTGVSTAASSYTLNSKANRNNTMLPKFIFPTFSGNYIHWSVFGLFNSSVVSNTT